MLDPVEGAAVRSVLEPLAWPMGGHDYRDRPKRLAEAFVECVTGGGKVNVRMQVTSSLETLLGLLGAPGAQNEFSVPVSSKTVERWACDCSITRVLMHDSVPIDVGRAARVIKGPQRRALIARDKHCQWPGRERPAPYWGGHHIVHWISGGGLELANMVLLCQRHHWMIHEGGWQVVKTEYEGLLPVAPMHVFGRPLRE
ncbi:MAG TPA: HNH endonuclease [Candidatus Dormibacteraeota bacterium]|nr:HNH endonuclease [Candidatus Dormibacteraeota bacterium]